MPTFKIVRLPDKEPMAFLCNNVLVHYVGTCPETGLSLYCSLTHNYGVRVCDKTGAKTVINPQKSGGGSRNLRYMNFNHAFGHHKHIFIHQAVWMAAGRTVPEGWELDHISGDKRDNSLPNLRIVTRQQNCRDGGFLIKLRNRKIDPVRIQRPYLLRFFDRMAVIKPAISVWKYKHLSRNDLQNILYMPIEDLQNYLLLMFNIQINPKQ
ncbi:MAG: HNH endonuclease [Paludibacteraceae bacterium]|nr:HNH endonuclease [Paludibacteraceae bacterium]